MDSRKPPKPSARAPQRSNGIKRRNAILDAAAAIISESGVAGLTLHATARRAASSIGSMYHFFTDKDQLLDALRERHRLAMEEMMAGVTATTAAQWQAMSAEAVIDRLFGGAIRYYAAHPYALHLHQLREGKAIDEFITLVESVMTLRLGQTRAPHVAHMLYAVSTGTLSFVLDVTNTAQRAWMADVPVVLAAYLAAQETRPQ